MDFTVSEAYKPIVFSGKYFVLKEVFFVRLTIREKICVNPTIGRGRKGTDKRLIITYPKWYCIRLVR